MASGLNAHNPLWNHNRNSSHRSWQSTPSRWRRTFGRLKVVGAVAVTVTVLSLLTWVATWFLPPQPSRIVLLGAQYQENLSVDHNAYGWNTLKDLAALGNEKSDFRFWGRDLLEIDDAPHTLEANDLGLERLEESYGDTIVVYVSAQGIADNENAYLLLENAQPTNDPSKVSEQRLSVDVLLDRLAKLPEERYKVLVLDATQQEHAWQFGMVYNNFARVLKDRNERIAQIPNLVVISASDVNQTSWPCRAWRRTTFGHFFIEGLRGAATDVDHDGRLDLRELHAFTTTKVERWAHSYHRALQTPLLLPAGKLGLARAAKVDLGVIRGNYQPTSPLAIDSDSEQSLAGAFTQYESLCGLQPQPVVYAPLSWKRYETIMLRMQSLVEAGDVTGVAHWRKELDQLAFKIREHKTTPLDSSLCSLAMPTVAGANGASPDTIAAIVSDLWQQPPTKVAQTYQQHLAALPQATTYPVAVQASVLRTLLERAGEDPEHNLAKAASIAAAIEDPSRARPAEIHFLLMLNDHLPKSEQNVDSSTFTSELVSQALQTRLLAERAAVAAGNIDQTHGGYCQEVSLWCQSLVAAGDAYRRQAEDLMFVSKQTAPRSAKLFTQANASYDQAVTLATQIRTCLSVRDLAMIKLPGYGTWLAAHLRQESYSANDEKMLVELEHLWSQTHALSGLVKIDSDLAAMPTQSLFARADEAAKAAAMLSDGLNRLDEQLQQWQRDLSQYESLANLDFAEAVTVLPPADAQLRMELLRRKWRLLSQPDMEMAANSRYTPISKEDQLRNAKMAAEVQGRLAIATLGADVFAKNNWEAIDAKSSKFTPETFESLSHRLKVFQVEEEWWRPLVIVGRQVGYQFNRMPPTIDKLCKEADGKPRPGVAKLQQAALLARQSPNVTYLAEESPSPIHRFRNATLEELLVWQASRTYQDHWDGLQDTSKEDQAEAFFVLNTTRYLDDAFRLDQYDSRIAQWRKELEKAFTIRFTAPDSVNWTTQQTQQVPLSLATISNQIGGGFAAVDVQAGRFLSLTGNSDPNGYALAIGNASNQMTKLPASPDQLQVDLRYDDLTNVETQPPQDCQPLSTGLTVNAFFRGRQVSQVIPIQLYPTGERMIMQFPPANTARLAVVASANLQQQLGSGRGAVSIVLDASGSMGPPAGQEMNSQTRYRQALSALQSVVNDLPAGTQLSVWIFGEAVGSEKSVDQAEQTIRQILPPTVWDGNRQDRLAKLMKSLDYPQVQPWNESPIVRTMLQAKNDLDSFQGPKTMIVITDGVDNRFAQDRTANPNGVSIATALATRFESSGIGIQVIGFQVKTEEQQLAKMQFEVVETFLPPGGFTLVDHVDDLRATLAGALQQQLEVVVSPLNASSKQVGNLNPTGSSSRNLSVGTFGGGDRWIDPPLAEGSYQIASTNASPGQAEISLNQGDLLWLKLSSEGNKLSFQPQPYAASRYPTRPFLTADGWRASMLENYWQADVGGEWMLSLESEQQQLSPLSVIRPSLCWLELSAAQANSSQNAKKSPIWITHCPAYPVPMLKLKQTNWPTDVTGEPSAADVSLWWNVAGDVPGVTLRKHQEFATLGELRGRSVPLSSKPVTIDSIDLETHVVATDEQTRSPQPCLVIRMSHAPGMPCLATAGQLSAVGQETRIFSAAGQTTVLIWPVTAASASQITSVQIIDLERLRSQSEAAGRMLHFDGLPAPTSQSQPPTAVQ